MVPTARRLLAGVTTAALAVALAVGAPLATASAATSPLVSDEFSSATLDPAVWSVGDPVGDGSVSVGGGVVSMSVPAGVSHDVWSGSNRGLRVVQGAPDADLQVETRFVSGVSQQYQTQGLMVLQDALNLVRFDVFSDGSKVSVFAASFVAGQPTVRVNQQVSFSSAAVLRVKRVGGSWSLFFGADGGALQQVGSFSFPLTVTQVGPYVANAGSAPAMTAKVDYFRVIGADTTAPVVSGVGAALVSGTDGAATVSWTTDEPASSRVEYGLSSAYGSVVSASALVSDHAVRVEGLACASTYHYRVVSADAAGNQGVSSDRTLATAACPPPDTTAPVVSGVSAGAGVRSATVSWTTDEPATSVVQYGPSTSYGSTGSASGSVTAHQVGLSGLDCAATYHYRVVSADAAGNTTTDTDRTFTTGTCPAGLVSDEFSSATLDPAVWSVGDPVGDGSVSVGGGVVSMSVPAGVSHDVWSGSNRGLRVVQGAPDADLQVETRFVSGVSQQYQTQGLMVLQDALNLVRFDVFSDGSKVSVFAASFVAGQPTVRVNQQVSFSSAAVLRVKRVGGSWSLFFGADGGALQQVGSFSFPLTVTQVGPYVANAGSAPAMTAKVDYFRVIGADTTAPVVSGVGAALVSGTDGAATVSWTTDEPASSRVEYGLSSAYGSVVSASALVSDHAVRVEGLACASTYHYRVVSADAAGNQGVSSDRTLATAACPPPDTTAPVVSGVSAGAGVRSATVSWTTDEPATSVVQYGPSTSYGSTGSASGSVTAHQVGLSGLDCAATYHYRVVSADAAGNTTTDTDRTFTTGTCPAGLVSDEFSSATLDPAVWSVGDPVGDGSVSVGGGVVSMSVPAGVSHDVWSGSNRGLRVVQGAPDADLQVETRFVSGVSQQYQTQGLMVLQDALNLVRFDVFSDGSKVSVFAASFVAGQPTVRVNQQVSFSSAAVLRVKRVGGSWSLFFGADGGALQQVGSFSFPLTVTQVGPYVANAGPAPAMTAKVDYFRVIGADTTAPVLSGISASAVAGSATVSWTTNESSTSLVDYGATTAYGSTASAAGSVTDHQVTVSPLTCATAYHYRVRSADAAGNTATGPDGTFTTAACPPPDTTAPVVSGVSAGAGVRSATVSWTTDEPATSVVQYGPSTSYGSTASASGSVTAHQVGLSGLDCAATYHYRVVSADAAGNTTTDTDRTFTTGTCPAGLVSDDFSSTTLDPAVWTVEDPVGDARLTMTGTDAVLFLPTDTRHDLWAGTDTVPKLMQATGNVDFDVTVKFDSPVEFDTQTQGLVVRQDATHLLRFDAFSSGGTTRAFAATIDGSSATGRANVDVAPSTARWLRIVRTGDAWSLRQSTDGTTWQVVASFTSAMNVTGVGVFGGNSQGSALGSSIDYFSVASDPMRTDDGGAARATSPGPTVTPWYGATQHVGAYGFAQQWVDVLGDVADADGVGMLRFSVDGGASQLLTVGPDNARLVDAGDFVAEVPRAAMTVGTHQVQLWAMDRRGDVATRTVQVVVDADAVPTLPYTVAWSGMATPDDGGRAQVIDGRWSVSGSTVRVTRPGYDRLVGIGSATWAGAYEVSAPVTLNSGTSGGMGFLVGWDGHTGNDQPHKGHPYGALAWYRASGLELVDQDAVAVASVSRALTVGTTYMMKLRATPNGDGTSRYQYKVWPQGQAEPAAWDVSTTLPTRAGSVVLVANLTDASFGTVTVAPLS